MSETEILIIFLRTKGKFGNYYEIIFTVILYI